MILQTELPHPDHPSPNSAAAVQELLGGKFGEMFPEMSPERRASAKSKSR